MRQKLYQSGLIFFCVAILGLAACAATTNPASAEKPNLIRIEVIGPKGPPIKSLVEDGSYLRIQDSTTGQALAFKPDVHATPPKIRVFQIEKGADGAESLRLLDESDVQIGASGPSTVAKIYSVRILEVIHPA